MIFFLCIKTSMKIFFRYLANQCRDFALVMMIFYCRFPLFHLVLILPPQSVALDCMNSQTVKMMNDEVWLERL